jgi:hypothetical protein
MFELSLKDRDIINQDIGIMHERARMIRNIAKDNNGDYEVAARSARISVAAAKQLVEDYPEEIDKTKICP